jgi:hypothetical protein
MPSKLKALSSNPSTTTTNNKEIQGRIAVSALSTHGSINEYILRGRCYSTDEFKFVSVLRLGM